MVEQQASPTAPDAETASFRRLLVWSAGGLVVCAALVALCYFFVDREVAFFVRERGVNRSPVLRGMTELPMALNALSALIVVLAAALRARGPLTPAERALFAASVSLMVAVALEWYVKALFGRYWPGTWINDNPSLLDTGAYGFHPFHFGEAYGSFPSGHTARTFAFLGVVWAAYPAWRWACTVVCASVVVALVGMDYHFVGDAVGGAYLGAVTAAYTARFFELGRRPTHSAPSTAGTP